VRLRPSRGRAKLTSVPTDSTYFSATKYAWLLENVPEVKLAKEAGTLMLGTVDSWIVYVRLVPSLRPSLLLPLTPFSSLIPELHRRSKEWRSPPNRPNQRLAHPPPLSPHPNLVPRAAHLLRHPTGIPPDSRLQLGTVWDVLQRTCIGGSADCGVDWGSAGGVGREQVFGEGRGETDLWCVTFWAES
jgi:hypothetical protein